MWRGRRPGGVGPGAAHVQTPAATAVRGGPAAHAGAHHGGSLGTNQVDVALAGGPAVGTDWRRCAAHVCTAGGVAARCRPTPQRRCLHANQPVIRWSLSSVILHHTAPAQQGSAWATLHLPPPPPPTPHFAVQLSPQSPRRTQPRRHGGPSQPAGPARGGAVQHPQIGREEQAVALQCRRAEASFLHQYSFCLAPSTAGASAAWPRPGAATLPAPAVLSAAPAQAGGRMRRRRLLGAPTTS